MDELAQEVGYVVLCAPVLLGIVWGIAHSPLLTWLIKLSFLILWGALTIGASLFVAIVIDFQHGRIGAGIATLVLGAFLGSFWIVFGLPELWRSIKTPQWKLWCSS